MSQSQSEGVGPMEELNKDEIGRIRSIFDSFDTNGDGTIDRSELAFALEKMEEKHDRATVNRLFDEVDGDRSGDITWEEFLVAVKRVRKGTEYEFGHIYQKQDFINKNDALRFAAVKGDLGEVTDLIEQGASPESSTSYGTSPIHLAALHGNLEIVEHLVSNKLANPSSKTNRGETALHFAAQRGHMDVCKYLITKGKCHSILFEEDLTGFTPLDHAKFRGKEETHKFLLGQAQFAIGGGKYEEKRIRFRRGSGSQL